MAVARLLASYKLINWREVVNMGLNRLMIGKKSSSSGGGGTTGDNAFVMTMGQAGVQYGYSRYNNATYGEVEGNVKHDGKAVTLVMVSYYGGWLDFAFNVEGVTGGEIQCYC
nr:MAG TPA: hypothetical protein [Bacteriophage sp.]